MLDLRHSWGWRRQWPGAVVSGLSESTVSHWYVDLEPYRLRCRLHQQVSGLYFVSGHLDAQGLAELDTARTYKLAARQPVAERGRRAEHPRARPAATAWSIATEEVIRQTNIANLPKVTTRLVIRHLSLVSLSCSNPRQRVIPKAGCSHTADCYLTLPRA